MLLLQEGRNSIISGYIIDISERDPPDSSHHEITVDRADQLSWKIQALEPFTEYQITVQAFTKQIQNGHGPLSEPIFVFTQ